MDDVQVLRPETHQERAVRLFSVAVKQMEESLYNSQQSTYRNTHDELWYTLPLLAEKLVGGGQEEQEDWMRKQQRFCRELYDFIKVKHSNGATASTRALAGHGETRTMSPPAIARLPDEDRKKWEYNMICFMAFLQVSCFLMAAKLKDAGKRIKMLEGKVAELEADLEVAQRTNATAGHTRGTNGILSLAHPGHSHR